MTQPKRTLLVLIALALSGCHSLDLKFGRANEPAAQTAPTDERSQTLYLSVIAELVANEKYHAALAHLASYERLYGSTPHATLLSANAWLRLEQLDEAEGAYITLLKTPLSADGLNGLGGVALARGENQAAARHFEAAVREQPTNVQFLIGHGEALAAIGNFTEAEFVLRQAYELAPGDEFVKKRLVKVLLAGGRDGEVPALTGGTPAPALDRTSFQLGEPGP
jgi:Flp pilus assembly protein TadD